MDAVPDFAPRADATTAPFWEATADGRLALPACPICGAWQWYPLGDLTCHPDARAQWRDVPHEGRVFTFTRVERAFLPHGGTPPFTVALIELTGVHGPRLVSVLVGPRSDDPSIGDPVRLAPTRFETHTLPTFELVEP